MSDLHTLMNRRRKAAQAKAPYIVRSINRNGAFSKMTPHPLDYHTSLEAAQRQVAELERLNPGSRFGIDTRTP
jgi:hypothetical protein